MWLIVYVFSTSIEIFLRAYDYVLTVSYARFSFLCGGIVYILTHVKEISIFGHKNEQTVHFWTLMFV